MAKLKQYLIGAETLCADGPAGFVTTLVVDPAGRVCTHVVVEPENRSGLGRLVPLLTTRPEAEGIRLVCTSDEFAQLPSAERVSWLAPGADVHGDDDAGEQVVQVYYPIRRGSQLAARPTARDALPSGVVGLEKGMAVWTTEGKVGAVEGVVADPETGLVSHVLLQHGHLLGKTTKAIPGDTVKRFATNGVAVRLTKDEISDLPAVDPNHPERWASSPDAS